MYITVSLLVSVGLDVSLLSFRIIGLCGPPAEVSWSQTLTQVSHDHFYLCVQLWAFVLLLLHQHRRLSLNHTTCTQHLKSAVKPPVFNQSVAAGTWRSLFFFFCALILLRGISLLQSRSLWWLVWVYKSWQWNLICSWCLGEWIDLRPIIWRIVDLLFCVLCGSSCDCS